MIQWERNNEMQHFKVRYFHNPKKNFPNLSNLMHKYMNKRDEMPDADDVKDLIELYNERYTDKKVPKNQYDTIIRKYLTLFGEEWRKRRLRDFRQG